MCYFLIHVGVHHTCHVFPLFPDFLDLQGPPPPPPTATATTVAIVVVVIVVTVTIVIFVTVDAATFI
jgi:hypothetical protein